VTEVRRVVTGHDANGKAVIVSDESISPITAALSPGGEWHNIWGADTPPNFPDDGSTPIARRYFPPVGGFRFVFFTIPPGDRSSPPDDLDVESAIGEMNEKLPGLIEYLEPESPGMHTTASIDYGIVLSGAATMELDDGAMVTLQPGDTYIQNGTRHRWSNEGDVPAVLACTLIGVPHGRVE
jgi:mannose-6-phosphate isomerase-like protein (cupin superfamily)